MKNLEKTFVTKITGDVNKENANIGCMMPKLIFLASLLVFYVLSWSAETDQLI